MVALLTAVLLLLARLLKLGFLADFLSQTVLVGFLTGVGFQVGIAVLGEMLGIEITSHRTVLQLVELWRSLSSSALADARRICRAWLEPSFCSAASTRKFPGR